MKTAQLLGIATTLSAIYTVYKSHPHMIYYYLTNYPWLLVNLRDVYIMCINKTWLSITALLLVFLLAEKIWGKLSGGYVSPPLFTPS